MNTSISAVGWAFEQGEEELINKKLQRIQYAADLIVDLNLRVKEDKKFIFECTVNFRWGTVAHVTAEDYEFAPGLNKLMDILDQKVKKEKDKIQEKNASETVDAGSPEI
jgi:putative sigma-54 modulation protein